MRPIILTFALLIFIIHSQAQGFKLEIFGGLVNYQGDLQPRIFTLQLAKPVYGGFLKYEVNGHIAARAGISLGSLYADDKYNKADLQKRNLNFRSKLTEAQLGVEYYILDIHNFRITPYLFAGIALFKYEPYTFDQSNVKTFLQPLSTEGQAISQTGVKEYKLQQMSIPFGGGLNFALSCNVNIAIELLQHKLSTDYLDDISRNYIDQNVLLAARGAKSVALAYRADELPGGTSYPNGGSQRGNPKENDWYYMATLKICLNLTDCSTGKFILGGSGNKGNNSKTGCPVNVY
ncbi:MAG TPA: DUF6089 family protein [Ferruginibacter sp.]|nr:DUF6089 family protein [Ferruginibacter sp.]